MTRRTDNTALHGWLVIDKPAGITSARVVGAVKRATGAKVGHAGTLDPLATGVLPLALGEATKTAQFATAGRKRYRFRVRWGVATDTDDREGEVIAESPERPDAAALIAVLPRFTGTILQRPPAYSAIKVAGRRAYALARAGEAPELRRPPGRDRRTAAARHARPGSRRFRGRGRRGHLHPLAGPRPRSGARHVGHIAELRRLQVGRFTEAQAISLEQAVALGHSLAASEHLLPIETALDDIPALAVTAAEAARLRHGQRIPLRDLRERLPANPIDANPIRKGRSSVRGTTASPSRWRVSRMARFGRCASSIVERKTRCRLPPSASRR